MVMGRTSSLRLLTRTTTVRCVHSLSLIYRPVNVVAAAPTGTTTKGREGASGGRGQEVYKLSKSQRLMVDHGIIRQSSCPGAYHLLPLGLRSLGKLTHLIDSLLEKIGCQKMQMPVLTSAGLWKTTGRLEDCGNEIMLVKDRHSKPFVLSPTHEEAVCDLLNCSPLSHRQLPLRLYQITDKFRDERRPRFGLLRGRQFLMKDLYTFDADEAGARKTYADVVGVYEELLTFLGLKWTKASGATGTIGGSLSHEFHLPSDVGEDDLLHCHSCHEVFNGELLAIRDAIAENASATVEAVAVASGGSRQVRTSKGTENPFVCINCGSKDLSSSKSIEVAHSFLLGTKYSKPLKTTFTKSDGSSSFMEMGCYGIGVTRLLAAAVEVLSTETEIKWPPQIAPYLFCVIPPKTGSKEENLGKEVVDRFTKTMTDVFKNEVVIDDRLDQTVGKRLGSVKGLGIPYVVVMGKSILQEPPVRPLIEIHDVLNGSTVLLCEHDAINYLYDVKEKYTIK